MAGLQQNCVLQPMLWTTEREQNLAGFSICSILAKLQAYLWHQQALPAIGHARIWAQA